MPRLQYPELVDISTGTALRNHYASVRERLGRGLFEHPPRKPNWTAPQIRELKQDSNRARKEENDRQLIRDARKRLNEKSSAYDIVRAVALAWNVSFDSLIGQSRRPMYALPRSVAMTLCDRLTELTLTRIAMVFGNRHHTTVYHSIKKYGPTVDAALASAEGEQCNTVS